MDGILAPWHWIIVIAVALVVFGPKKLPELGSSLGKGIAGFRNGLKEAQDDLTNAVVNSGVSTDPVPLEPSATPSTDAAAVDAEQTPQA